jgi:hypothetical protein
MNEKRSETSGLFHIQSQVVTDTKDEEDGNTLEYSATRREIEIKEDSMDEDEESKPLTNNKMRTILSIDGDELDDLTPSRRSYIISEYQVTSKKSGDKSSSKKILASKQLKPSKIKYHRANENKENLNPANTKSNSCLISPSKNLQNLSPSYKRKLNFSNLHQNTIILNSDDEIIYNDKVGSYGNRSTRNTSTIVHSTFEDRPRQRSHRDNKSSCKTFIHLENQNRVKKISTLTDISKLQPSSQKKQCDANLETIYNLSETFSSRSAISSNDILILESDAKFLFEWLNSINLLCYYTNFIEKGLVAIDRIIDEWTEDNRLMYEDIENLGIQKPGHIFKILTKLEIDAKMIDENLYQIIFGNNTRSSMRLRISSEKTTCCGFTNEKKSLTNDFVTMDLTTWLKKMNLSHLRTNFVFNGFDHVQFLIMQMFTTYPVDDVIVEHCLDVYNKRERDIILECLAKDVNHINIKISRMCNAGIGPLVEDNVVDEGCKACTIF